MNTTATTGIPIQASSKKLSPGPPLCAVYSPLTTRLVLLPIRVQVPPAIPAKLSGIISRDSSSRCRRAQSCTAGRNTATTGVLLINALNAATGAISRSRADTAERGRPSKA